MNILNPSEIFGTRLRPKISVKARAHRHLRTVKWHPPHSPFPSPFPMSNWPATKARRVLAALERTGWQVCAKGPPTASWSTRRGLSSLFTMLARIAKRTGLKTR